RGRLRPRGVAGADPGGPAPAGARSGTGPAFARRAPAPAPAAADAFRRPRRVPVGVVGVRARHGHTGEGGRWRARRGSYPRARACRMRAGSGRTPPRRCSASSAGIAGGASVFSAASTCGPQPRRGRGYVTWPGPRAGHRGADLDRRLESAGQLVEYAAQALTSDKWAISLIGEAADKLGLVGQARESVIAEAWAAAGYPSE